MTFLRLVLALFTTCPLSLSQFSQDLPQKLFSTILQSSDSFLAALSFLWERVLTVSDVSISLVECFQGHFRFLMMSVLISLSVHNVGVYLHDPRCICKEAKTKTRRKNKEDVVLDALFWPVMPYPMVAAKLDMNRQPHVIQPYSVPLPQADQYQKHDATVYSMWMHFVDFCLATSDSNNARHADSAPCYAAPNVPINSYTGEARLKFFQFLSSCNGRVVSREELMRCTGTPVPLPHGAPRQAHTVSRRVSDEASHPYFTSSAPPLAEVQQQQVMRQHRSLPGERDGYAPAAQQQQSVLYARSASATNPNAGFVNPGLQVNTNANATIQSYNDPRLNHASGQSISPVSYEQRSPHVNYGSASTTQQALLQTQSRTMNGGSTSALYGPSGSLSSSTSAATSPTVKPDAPTTLSVLMNTVPQSQLSALNGTQLGSMQILGAAQADPWLVDACGLTDTEEDRDSGSSYNSAPLKQFRSVWNEASEDTAALSFNMLNGLI